MRTRTPLIILCLFVFLGNILVGQRGQRAQSHPVPKSKENSLSTQELLDLFEKTFYRLNSNYVDEINEEVIIKSAIRGMFEPLDPYTVFLDGAKKDRIELLTKGRYGGIGIHITLSRDTLIILSPIENSPAYNEGLMSGDKIIMVDSVSTIGMTINEAGKLIKGDIGTEVMLTIIRPSTKKRHSFKLVRANIPVLDIPYAGVDPTGIGYLRVNKFSRNSSAYFRDSLQVLLDQDLQGLIVDLRGNSGGLLQQALSILDLLTPRNEVLLSTSGRNRSSNKTSLSRVEPLLPADIPVAVLINKSSASASEIVAGVLQDLDRAVILGTRSFGKGLVQSIYTINDSTKMKITTAKYYTPSGRLIQKLDYLENGALTDGYDKLDTTFHTRSGREVRAAGGISPDIRITARKRTPFVNELWRQGLFLSFASQYVPENDIKLPIDVNEKVMTDFEKFLQNYEFEYKEPGENELARLKEILARNDDLNGGENSGFLNQLLFWRQDQVSILSARLDKYYLKRKNNPFNPANEEWIKNGLLREMSRVASGNDAGAAAAALEYDPVYLEAVAVLRDANRYYDLLSPPVTADEIKPETSQP